MANSSILGGERAASTAKGRDVDALGPSDSSDSGSDVQGERTMPTGADSPDEFGALPVERRSDSDSFGTGERASATGDDPRDSADLLPDRIGLDPSVPSNDALDHVGTSGIDLDDLAVDDGDEEDEEEIAYDEAEGRV